MRKLLNSLGDRMLSGLECSPQDKCAFSYPFCPGQAFRTKFRRTRCSDGSATPWKRVGCC
jgi:hypothetical protein